MIYFDNAATTKPSIDALNKASIYNSDCFFNPSALYQGGLNSSREIKTAKETILKSLGCANHEVIFTSCGSESDNMAIFCSVRRGIFVTSKGEHSAVFKSFHELKQRGQTVLFADLNSDGSVNVDSLLNILKNNVVDFVSIVHVNNETGAINDVNAIAKKIKEINKKTIFHVDGVQAYAKIPFRLSSDIDLYSISAHKINALKGTGALIRRKGVNLTPLIFGGGQENGLRSGTENIFGIKVFEYASISKFSALKENFEYVSKIKQVLIDNLDKNLFIKISGDNSSPYILTISAVGVRGEVVMHALETEGVVVGNGSACSSKNRYSRVIEACGYGEKVLDGVIRLSFSVENNIEEAIIVAEKLNNIVRKFKGIMK